MIASGIMPALRLLHLVPYQVARVAALRLRLARVRDSGHPRGRQIGVNSRDDMAAAINGSRRLPSKARHQRRRQQRDRRDEADAIEVLTRCQAVNSEQQNIT